MTRRIRDEQADNIQRRNNVSHNPIGTVSSEPLASAPGKAFYPRY